MEQLVKDWFERAGKGKKKQQALQVQTEQRNALLLQLAQQRDVQARTIEEGVDQIVTQEKGGKPGKSQNTRRLDNDQLREFDIDEQKEEGYRLAKLVGKTVQLDEWDPETGTQEQFEKLQKAGRLIDDLALRMETAMVPELDESGKEIAEKDENDQPIPGKVKMRRMFSDEDIANELYDPLRRAGLMPETMIPDKYSRTHEMLEGTMEAYAERLKRDEKGLLGQAFSENFALAKTMAGSLMTLASTGEDLKVSMGKEAKDLVSTANVGENIKGMKEALEKGGLDRVNQITKFASQGYGFVFGVADKGVEDAIGGIRSHGEKTVDEAKARRRVSALVAQGVVTAGAMTLGSALNADQAIKQAGLAMTASSTFGALLTPATVAALMNQEKLGVAHIDQVAKVIGEALADTMENIDWGDKTGAVSTAVAALGNVKPDAAAVVEKIVAGEVPDAVLLFEDAIKKAVAAGITNALFQAFSEDDDNGIKAKAKASGVLEQQFSGKESEPPDELAEEHKGLGHEPEWVHGSKGWACTVCDSQNTDDPKLLAGMLDRRIARLKRDQALLNWGASLAGMAIDVATNFVAPLAIAGCAVKVAKNLWEAANRTRDTLAFIEDRKGMLLAASAYSAPVSQFIDNSTTQAQHYLANASFEAVKMIGAIVQCTGVMAAPVGVGLQAGASAAQAVEQVLYELDKRLKLETAWTMYKRALERPENRKMGLEAMAKNPTLAKYAMAWGAVIKEDVLVEDFMDSCGLSADTLKDPKGGLEKVVTYLELRFSDDNVVTGRKIRVDAAVLSLPAWLRQKAKLEKDAKLEPQETRQLEAALLALEQGLEDWRKRAGSAPSTLKASERTLVLQHCHDAWMGLNVYRAVLRTDAGGGACPEAVALKTGYQRALKRLQDEVNAWKTMD